MMEKYPKLLSEALSESTWSFFYSFHIIITNSVILATEWDFLNETNQISLQNILHIKSTPNIYWYSLY